MSFDFHSVADDFFVNMGLQTTLALPKNRETVLHFCEAVQREWPVMTTLYQRGAGTFVLEADRESGSYPWMEIEPHRLSAGWFNPPDTEEAHRYHKWLLHRCVYFLGVSALDVEALDVVMGFNVDYCGNRDAVVAEALLGGSPLGSIASEGGAHTAEFEPNLVFSLDEECYQQARLGIETRGSAYQIRTGNYENEPITVYFIVRSYPRPGELFDLTAGYPAQRKVCEEYVREQIIPQVIQPITSIIAGK